MNVRRSTNVLGISVATILYASAVGSQPADEALLNLNDFDWSVGGIRTEMSVQRERPSCLLLTKGEDEEFKSGGAPFSVIPVTLKARKAGTLVLIPELFLVRDGVAEFRPCQGLRFVQPKQDPRLAAFHPPACGHGWPGREVPIACEVGEEVVVELLFLQVSDGNAEILAAFPAVPLQGTQTQNGPQAIDHDKE